MVYVVGVIILFENKVRFTYKYNILTLYEVYNYRIIFNLRIIGVLWHPYKIPIRIIDHKAVSNTYEPTYKVVTIERRINQNIIVILFVIDRNRIVTILKDGT